MMVAPDEVIDPAVTEEMTGGVVSGAALRTVTLTAAEVVRLPVASRGVLEPYAVVRPYSACASAGSLVVQVMVAVVEVREETVTEEMTGGVVSAAAAPEPVTERAAVLALELKRTVLAKLPAAGGLKRATTVWLVPGERVNAPPETMLKGVALATVPVRAAPPVLVTVKERSAEAPTETDPKSVVIWGVTAREGVALETPLRALAVAAVRASISAPRSRPSVAA